MLFLDAIRSEDCFLMKNDRGDGQGKQGDSKHYLGARWHRQANRKAVENCAMRAQVSKVEETQKACGSDSKLARPEKACHDWFLSRRPTLLTPERRKAWSR
ncbi:hypothetical protein ACN2XU_19755 [Primorskyibacter sp. 2E107]|uniref:hypothetical protein n=1 Tax=Primorskyibacter sp. 2E107 TaxID=3403458 RepID=UPI003AF89853